VKRFLEEVCATVNEPAVKKTSASMGSLRGIEISFMAHLLSHCETVDMKGKKGDSEGSAAVKQKNGVCWLGRPPLLSSFQEL
jgi:hypothetical protein